MSCQLLQFGYHHGHAELHITFSHCIGPEVELYWHYNNALYS
jgi:hypothetical protein